MKYKVGDTVLIKSWGELVEEFGIDNDNLFVYTSPNHWYIHGDDSLLPENRIVTLNGFNTSNEPYFNSSYGDRIHILFNIIKCHANEYYLQQIKEEMNEV